MAVRVQTAVFWVLTLCCIVGGYQCSDCFPVQNRGECGGRSLGCLTGCKEGGHSDPLGGLHGDSLDGRSWINNCKSCNNLTIKTKLTHSYEGRQGDNWIIEDVEIGFPLPGDMGQHAPSPQMTGGIMWNNRLKEVVETRHRQAGTRSVLQSMQCFHV
jgi:hypothetical protein